MARLLGFLAVALSAALLVPATAQDKKDGDKREPGKTDKDKTDKKKEDPKPKPEPKLEYGQVLSGKLRAVRERTLEIAEVDKKKLYDLQNELSKLPILQRQQRLQKADVYADKGKEYRTADSLRIRSSSPPIEYDDKGFAKQNTAKRERLPNGKWVYLAEFDSLRAGQLVTVYLAKTKTPPKKDKKGLKLDDEDEIRNRPEILMIVITAEPPKGQ